MFFSSLRPLGSPRLYARNGPDRPGEGDRGVSKNPVLRCQTMRVASAHRRRASRCAVASISPSSRRRTPQGVATVLLSISLLAVSGCSRREPFQVYEVHGQLTALPRGEGARLI